MQTQHILGSRSRSMWCGVASFGLVTILALSASLWGQGRKPPATVPEFADAKSVVKARDAVGPKLMEILNDEKRPDLQRLEAATWLGQLQYAPAIPLLVKHVELYERGGVVSDDGSDFPCQQALRQYGDAAVPNIVAAYVAADTIIGSDRERSLLSAMTPASMLTAWTYAKGLAAENPDPVFQVRVSVFLGSIKPYVQIERKKKKP